MSQIVATNLASAVSKLIIEEGNINERLIAAWPLISSAYRNEKRPDTIVEVHNLQNLYFQITGDRVWKDSNLELGKERIKKLNRDACVQIASLTFNLFVNYNDY